MQTHDPARQLHIDALRGVAMVWMTCFHFCFDLNHFGLLRANFYDDPFWTVQRSVIVSLFLACAGLGQAAAAQGGVTWPRFWKRWARIVGCALLVSAGSYVMFPSSYIYFGILHGMAVMVLLARLLAPCGPVACIGVAAGVYILNAVAPGAHALWPGLDILDGRGWNWLGLISHKPVTEDYAPLVPWLGTLLLALALGLRWHPSPAFTRRLEAVPLARGLALLGRWSLPYYMVHQPLLIGAVMLALQVHRG